MIWEGLKESLFFLDIHGSDYTDILKAMGEAMYKEGYVKKDYTEALIEREKKFPTGLDIQGIGVAIPHTDIGYVYKNGIGIAVLKKPVQFNKMGDENKKIPVRIILTLAVLEPSSHIDYLQRVLKIIQDAEVLKKILSADNYNAVIDIIRKKEETL